MYVVWVEFEVVPAQQAAFLAAVRENARLSLTEPECYQFDVCVQSDAPQRIALYELYGCEADFRAHLQTPHFHAFNAQVTPWVTDKRVVCYQRAEPLLG